MPLHIRKTTSWRRFLALTALVFQNSALVIVMKLSYSSHAEHYSSRVVILLSEALKLTVCVTVVLMHHGAVDSWKFVKDMDGQIFALALPAVLYFVQNTLLFIAVKGLSPMVYVVASQNKVVTSAVFSVVMLGTKFSARQWWALVQLMFGMVLVQTCDVGYETSIPAHSERAALPFLAVALATVTSGYAGVYMERLYKTSRLSIWERNVQLSIVSIPIALLPVIKELCGGHEPLFTGLNSTVRLVIVLHSCGGLLTAAVMKYATALLKCFAIGCSICVCTLYSVYYSEGEVKLNAVVGCGMLLVVVSITLFTIPIATKNPS